MQTQQPDTIKRDKLAVQRNQLANERTLLAYVRTSLSFIGFGVLVLKLFIDQDFHYVAIVSILLGIIIMILGVISFRKNNKKIAEYNG